MLTSLALRNSLVKRIACRRLNSGNRPLASQSGLNFVSCFLFKHLQCRTVTGAKPGQVMETALHGALTEQISAWFSSLPDAGPKHAAPACHRFCPSYVALFKSGEDRQDAQGAPAG